jgi:choline-sulfatase
MDGERGRMLMNGRYKYIRYDEGKNAEQLMDLKSDPGEMRNGVKDPRNKKVLGSLKKTFLTSFPN